MYSSKIDFTDLTGLLDITGLWLSTGELTQLSAINCGRTFKLLFSTNCPVDTGRKLNVHKTFRRRPGRLMYVQFTSCVYGVSSICSFLRYSQLLSPSLTDLPHCEKCSSATFSASFSGVSVVSFSFCNRSFKSHQNPVNSGSWRSCQP